MNNGQGKGRVKICWRKGIFAATKIFLKWLNQFHQGSLTKGVSLEGAGTQSTQQELLKQYETLHWYVGKGFISCGMRKCCSMISLNYVSTKTIQNWSFMPNDDGWLLLQKFGTRRLHTYHWKGKYRLLILSTLNGIASKFGILLLCLSVNLRCGFTIFPKV